MTNNGSGQKWKKIYNMSNFFNKQTVSLEWGGHQLTFETGEIARQADGAVLVRYGDTAVLATIVASRHKMEGQSFFPLSVHYQEKASSAGRIPGGFLKRESKPSEREALISRLIDRPLRPLFDEFFFNEVQIVCTVLSYDLEVDSDIAAIVAASAALAISGLPVDAIVGAGKVGYVNGAYVFNPTTSQLRQSSLELMMAGTTEGVLMVESQAAELDEDIMLGALEFGHENFLPIIAAIEKLVKLAGKPKWPEVKPDPLYPDILGMIQKKYSPAIKNAYKIQEKQKRHEELHKIKDDLIAKVAIDYPNVLNSAFKQAQAIILRQQTLKTKKRIDGRDLNKIRPIDCQTGMLPKTHGSALFTRGETQALVTVTLGTGDDEQMIDSLSGEYFERFLLHYNFPPYSVGEVGRLGAPGRREIGHGRLAWRSMACVIPPKTRFPYTILVASNITESNGSSSMATVCGSSLALMDAGVPLLKAVAGISMGLIKENKNFVVLSDILGDEDHLGDMDFKVAGTIDGISALQMDIKITGITFDIMKAALEQAKEGRLHILGEMNKALTTNRSKLSVFAPQLEQFKIPKDKIRDVIGAGGKVIRDICERTTAKIDISDDGLVTVSALGIEKLNQAVSMVQAIVTPPEVGAVHLGKVVRVLEFGAIVSFAGGHEGMVHISELSKERVRVVEDVVKLGDEVTVKVIGVEDRGKIKLSMKALVQ